MTIRYALLVSALSLIATPVFAQKENYRSAMKDMNMPKSSEMKMDNKSAGLPITEGEVQGVDREQGTVTLKHGEIKNMGMPAMTMVFPVKDKAMLGQVKQGDKVKFAVDSIKNQMTITNIEPRK